MNKHPLDPPLDIQFRKSSYSNDQDGCVEVAVAADGGRWLRDTKDRATPAHYSRPPSGTPSSVASRTASSTDTVGA